jgi:ABC-type polysaccharide/polyol phosphate transport system ATPase subunit
MRERPCAREKDQLARLPKKEMRAGPNKIVAFAKLEIHIEMLLQIWPSGVFSAHSGFSVASHEQPKVVAVDKNLANEVDAS